MAIRLTLFHIELIHSNDIMKALNLSQNMEFQSYTDNVFYYAALFIISDGVIFTLMSMIFFIICLRIFIKISKYD